MTTIAQFTSCSTAGCRALDYQLIRQIDRIAPGLLVDFSHLNVSCGGGVHSFLQAPAVQALERAIADRGTKMGVNSAYRTLPQQAILYAHYKNHRCGIIAAATPGNSNHNTALSLDLKDPQGWRPYLEKQGWDWLGSFDPMHFDFKGYGVKDLAWLSIKAFQQLWNYNYPDQRIHEDGRWGSQTEKALLSASPSGFDSVPGFERSQNIPELSTAKSLREGNNGEVVRKLQEKLGVKVDGIFGAATTAAVQKYQRDRGLTPDGIVGVQTSRMLGLTE